MQILGGNFDRMTSRSNYDSFFQAFLSSFQVMVTENWNSILQTVFASSVNKYLGVFYLSSWVIIGNWILLNLFLAIILDEFTNDDAKRDLKEIEEEEMDEDEENQLYSQYMTMSGSGLNQTSLMKTGATGSQQGAKKSGLNSSSHIASAYRQSIRNTTDQDFDLYEKLEHLEDQKKSNKKPLFASVECEDAFFVLDKSNKIRIFCYRVVKHSQFENVILAAIVVSSLKLALETYFEQGNTVMSGIDYFFNVFFAIEMLLKTISMGFILDKGSYLRDTWNILDGFIVVTSIIDMSVPSVNISFIRVRLFTTFFLLNKPPL